MKANGKLKNTFPGTHSACIDLDRSMCARITTDARGRRYWEQGTKTEVAPELQGALHLVGIPAREEKCPGPLSFRLQKDGPAYLSAFSDVESGAAVLQ